MGMGAVTRAARRLVALRRLRIAGLFHLHWHDGEQCGSVRALAVYAARGLDFFFGCFSWPLSRPRGLSIAAIRPVATRV